MHACINVCMYALVCACTCACMHARMYLCMYVCMHKCMHVCTCCIKAYKGASYKNLIKEHMQHLHTHTYIHTCMHAYMPAFVQTRTRQKVVGNFKAARLFGKKRKPELPYSCQLPAVFNFCLLLVTHYSTTFSPAAGRCTGSSTH